uniref:EB domain-containing protein n=1 Tax=Elaeophora elaphi TaxID=1147741 RepID=A0A0R3RFU5_9BILA
MSCPFGYSCTHSAYYGIYMCCRFGSDLRCASGTNILLIVYVPRLCSIANAHANIQICCGDIHAEDGRPIIPSFDSDIKCQNDLSIPALIHYHYIRFCPTLGSAYGCPEGYLCSKSSRAKEAVCGKNELAYYQDGKTLECSEDEEDICPEHYVCQPSLTNTKMYCCLTDLRCSSGVPQLQSNTVNSHQIADQTKNVKMS